MTSTLTAVPAPARSRSFLRGAGHYLEMVLAMGIGMVALAPLWSLAWPGLAVHPDLETLTMALDMTVAMGGWMRLRRHSWGHIARMCAAMNLGFALVLPAYWAGALSAGAMEGLGHALMLVLMALAMLPNPFRRTP
jgi:flagellar biosynthetic protein FliP